MPPLIELKDVTYAYDAAFPTLDHLNFSFDAEPTAIVGDNGSGKTTLLHLIMGLIHPQAGQVFFHGEEMTRKSNWRQLRKSIGFVFQQPDDQLFMPTVIEDVCFGPLNLGLDPDQARQVAEDTLERLGIGKFADRLTHKLSGGEKRLVALATVLSMEPEALILDEPTNDLDPDTRHRLIHILQDLPQKLLIVSHDWDFLDQIVKRLAVLDEGKIAYRDFSVLHVHKHAHLGGGADHHHE